MEVPHLSTSGDLKNWFSSFQFLGGSVYCLGICAVVSRRLHGGWFIFFLVFPAGT